MATVPSPRWADTVYINGDVWTQDVSQPQAQAFALANGRYLAVGNNNDVRSWCGPQTQVVDLAGHFVMPGLFDTHVHTIWGGLRDVFEAYVGFSPKISALMQAVVNFVNRFPQGQWIKGGPWYQRDVDALSLSPRDFLDQYAPHHPVALIDATYHSLWVNSLALRLCGIDRNTPDPEGGRIVRDAQGQPNGLLYESAQGLVRGHLQPSAEQRRDALAYAVQAFHALGIVGFKEAMADEDLLQTYCAADRADVLNLHAAMHLSRKPLSSSESVPLETLERWRRQYSSTHVHTGFVKLFLDGVAPNRTASFLEPYLPCAGCAPEDYRADELLLITPQELANELIEFDRRGFVVKMHAVGDRASRAGLDAIEAARKSNGPSGLRHEIGHTAFVHEADHGRFRALDVVAEMSPRLWFPNPVTPGQYAVLGKSRTNRCHQIRSLLDAGAELTYGSDWPAAAADPNPWIGLAGMVSRRHPMGLFEGTVGEDQAVTLERALPLFTINAARSLGLEPVTGSITVGKSADFIRLEKSLFELSVSEIAQTRPLQTVFEGRLVHER